MPLFDEVRMIIARQLEREPASLDAETNLAEAGLGSLDVVELIFLLEERFDISLPYGKPGTAMPLLRSIGDVVAMLEALGVSGATA